MASLTEQLTEQLSGAGLSQIGKAIGADEAATGSLLATIGPLLTSALAKNASTPDGAQALANALSKDHDGSILDDVGGYLGKPEAADGAGILGHILGGKQAPIEQGLAKSSGLSAAQVAQLMQVVAPLLMGLLGKKQRAKALDPNGLSAYLGGKRQVEEQQRPDMMKVLAGMLDAGKGGGSSMDDIMGMAGKLFGRR